MYNYKINDKFLLSCLEKNYISIFLFHGVVKKKTENNFVDYINKHLDKTYFEKIIKFLKFHGKSLSMSEAVYILENKLEIPKNAFVITFDDGFKNNYEIACPILDYYKINSIFYVTSSFIEENKNSWIDDIEIDLINTKMEKVNLFNKSFKIISNKEKKFFLEFIRHEVKIKNNTKIIETVKKVFSEKSYDNNKTDDYDEYYRKMDWDNVISLSQNPLFEVGGHTHTHCILGHTSKENIEFEINKNQFLIKKNMSKTPIHFSYPEGQSYSFNSLVIDTLKNYKYKSSVTTLDNINNYEVDLFKLNRITIN